MESVLASSTSAAPRILGLEQQVVNRIAAGEVIHRPASALKEMIENSLDAGAKSIAVLAKGGGLKLLQIQDTGHGIYPADFPKVCERFATSKLREYEDLENIETFGFRGEALASISHVAHVTITSKTEGSACAYRATFADGLVVPAKPGDAAEAKPCAGTIGTTIVVEDMFYNVQTRRSAMKSVGEEYNKLLQIVQAYAIDNAGVAISCRKGTDGGAEIATLKEHSTTDVVRHVHGASVARELLPLEGADAELGLTAHGLMSNASYSAKKLVFLLFINKRLVESATIQRALQEAYAACLPKGGHPFVYLSLRLPPASLDVNVHPTKREVFFLDQQRVVAAVQSLVKEKLVGANAARTFVAQAPLSGAVAGGGVGTSRGGSGGGGVSGSSGGGGDGDSGAWAPSSEPPASHGGKAASGGKQQAGGGGKAAAPDPRKIVRTSTTMKAGELDKYVCRPSDAVARSCSSSSAAAVGSHLRGEGVGSEGGGSKGGGGQAGSSEAVGTGAAAGTEAAVDSEAAVGTEAGGSSEAGGGQAGGSQAGGSQAVGISAGSLGLEPLGSLGLEPLPPPSQRGRRRGRGSSQGAGSSSKRAREEPAGPVADTDGGGGDSAASTAGVGPAELELEAWACASKRTVRPAAVQRPWVSCELTSIHGLLRKVTAHLNRTLHALWAQHTFVGIVDRRYVLLQHLTKLYAVHIGVSSECFFYQQALRRWGNLAAIRLSAPVAIADLYLLGAALAADDDGEDDGEDDGGEDGEEEEGGGGASGGVAADRRRGGDEIPTVPKVRFDRPPSAAARRAAAQAATLLNGKSEMLLEYLSIEIFDGELCAIPQLVDGYVPPLNGLPAFVRRLVHDVDWTAEQPCFDGLAKQLAALYRVDEVGKPPKAGATVDDEVLSAADDDAAAADGDEAGAAAGMAAGAVAGRLPKETACSAAWTIQHVLLPAMRKHYEPPTAHFSDGSIVQLASTEQLYKIFERC